MKNPSLKEQEAILKLGPDDRVDHFVKVVADFEEAWSLWSDGWALMADSTDAVALPVWPAKAYALAFIKGEWSNYEPRAIALDDLVDDFLASLAKRPANVAVFPTPEHKGVVLAPGELARRLRVEVDASYAGQE